VSPHIRHTPAAGLTVLALSDAIVPYMYSPQVRRRFPEVGLVIGCGDLPYYYLEYIYDALGKPLFFVRGNHDKIVEYSVEGQRVAPCGGINLHRQVINHQGLLLAGVEGCLRYRPGPFMYTQAEMWLHVFSLAPRLLANRLAHGRCLDLFVTHAPPTGIHDGPDLPHQGIHAFRWFLRVFKPAFHLHGHIHVYRPDTVTETRFGATQVLNVFNFRQITINAT
jgi:Icc-related predicted phosphoesterase